MKIFYLKNQELKSFTVGDILASVNAYLKHLAQRREETMAFEKKTAKRTLKSLLASKNPKTNVWVKYIIENDDLSPIPIDAFYGIYLRVEAFKYFLETLPAGDEILFLNMKMKQAVPNFLELILVVCEYRPSYGIFALNVPVLAARLPHTVNPKSSAK